MKKSSKALIWFLLLLIPFIALSNGCFKRYSLKFEECTYVAERRLPEISKDNYIDEMTLTLTEIKNKEFEKRNGVNTVKNRVDHRCYDINVSIRFNKEKTKKRYLLKTEYEESLPRNDCYMFIIHFDNEDLGIKGEMLFAVIFSPYYGVDESIAGKVDVYFHHIREYGENKYPDLFSRQIPLYKKQDKILFEENTFISENYVLEEKKYIKFSNEIDIELFQITLSEITEEEFKKSKFNVLRNIIDNKCYKVELGIKFKSDEKLKNYPFKYMGKDDRSDGYKILLFLEHEPLKLKGELNMVLCFGPRTSPTYREASSVGVYITNIKMNDIDNNPEYFLSYSAIFKKH